MGYLRNPRAFLLVIKAVMEKIGRRFILFTSEYGPLDSVIRLMAGESGQLLFENRLFCFSGWAGFSSGFLGFTLIKRNFFGGHSDVPYCWLFDKCAAVIHHGGRLEVQKFDLVILSYRWCENWWFIPLC